MLKYRLVVHWHHTPSKIEQSALVQYWGRSLTANNRQFLLDAGKEIMATLRNISRVDVAENTAATPSAD